MPVRRGREEALVTTDESPRRDTSAEALARLKPAFDLPTGDDAPADGLGTVTAGNAPGITDGAAATVVASEREVERLGLTPACPHRRLRPGRGRAQVALPRPGGRRPPTARADGPGNGGLRPHRDQRGLRRPDRWPTGASSASTGTGSTSTAARSRSAIPSERAGRGSRPRCCTSCGGVAAGTGSPHSVSAAVGRWPWPSSAFEQPPLADEPSRGSTRGGSPDDPRSAKPAPTTWD